MLQIKKLFIRTLSSINGTALRKIVRDKVIFQNLINFSDKIHDIKVLFLVWEKKTQSWDMMIIKLSQQYFNIIFLSFVMEGQI